MAISRRDSIFSAFRIGPVASARKLSDIDTVLFKIELLNHLPENLKVLARLIRITS